MASILYPYATRGFWLMQQDEGCEWDVELTTSRAGKVTTRSLPGMRWTCTLQWPDASVAHLIDRRQAEAVLVQLRGGAVRLRLWNLLTPEPLGTLRGAPVIAAPVARGDRVVQLSGCNGGLLRMDRIALNTNGQRVMVVEDCVPDGSGNMTVHFEPAARSDITAGVPLVWSRPTTPYALVNPKLVFPQRVDQLPGFAIELIEAEET